MALSQLVTQVPGGLIKSGDWNNEFQNILTHPIALISPSTGAINFNLQSHSNLLPSAITATSGTAGQALMSTGGTTVTFQSVVSTFAAATGSTGQVFAITSSNSAPTWQVIPISGGLTSGVVSSGTIFYVSSSGVLTPLPIGSSGQVLTVTSSLPAWSASAAANFTQSFVSTSTAAISLSAASTFAHGLTTTPKLVQVSMVNTSSELSYSVGDEVLMPGGNSFSAAGNIVVWDGTNINVITGSALAVLNKTTFASANINATRWFWRVRAWA